MKKLIESPDYHLVGDDKGNWRKVPGRLLFKLSATTTESYSDKIEQIVQNENLTEFQKKCIKKRISSFMHTYEELHNYLTTQETDASIQLKSTKIESMWHSYLISSRELIDEIGLYIHTCFGIKEKTNGLNRKKLDSLLKNIIKAKKYKEDLIILEEIIKEYHIFLIEHIALRDRNKTHRDTLVEAPWINPSKIPNGGLLVNKTNDQEYNFVNYFYNSYKTIQGFAERILK